MERESDNSDLLSQRINPGLNHSSSPANDASELQDVLQNLLLENNTLRQTLRLQNGLRHRFEQLYNESPIGYLTISGNGCIVEANLMIAGLLGVQRSWLIGHNIDRYISSEDHALFSQHISRVRDIGIPDVCTLTLMTGNQSYAKVRMKSTPCPTESQPPYNTIYSSIIINDQPGYQSQLLTKQGEDRTTDLSTKNEKLKLEIQHYQETESAFFQHHDQLEKFIKQQNRELETLRNQLNKESTDRKQVEKEVQQLKERLDSASRISSLVEMASGHIHEIDQPLSAITTYTNNCLNKLQSNETPQRLKIILEQISIQTQRIQLITHHLQNFITNNEPHRENTNIAEIVHDCLKAAHKETTNNKIQVNVTHAGTIPIIKADPAQIKQVILNLIQNATESLKKVASGRRELHINIDNSQTHICITLHDTGLGVTNQNAHKITNPFFTTKTDGMGLGLTISRTIIEDHGGSLSHIRNLKKGATFQISLAINGRRDSL